MNLSTSRRINFSTKFDIFWITDPNGKYGFHLQMKTPLENLDLPLVIKGITLIKINTANDCSNLFLLLNIKEDWQIFKLICDDLISLTLKCDSDIKLVNLIEARLKRWQQLLKQNINPNLTIEKQMGLFSELLCLKYLITTKQIKAGDAVLAWVGPESDKQDFLTKYSALEIKSYITSKTPTVTISSVEQLSTTKDFLYLLAYGLTPSPHGVSIEDISREIRELLFDERGDILDLYENKLLKYGYVPDIIREPLYKFIIDIKQTYHIAEDFPRLCYKDIKPPIVSVKYDLDLQQCSDYIISWDSIVL